MSDASGPQRVDTLRDMIIFVEVGRRETFTRAARALGLPVSTIARRVAALEAELGLSLVERSTREQRLTADGVRCFERCRGAVDDALAACDDVQSEARGLAGRIRLALPGEAAAGALARIVAGFLRENAGVEIAVETARGEGRLGHDLDLLVRLGPPDDAALVARRIGSVELRLYASPGYLAARGPVASRAGLQGHDLLAAAACAGALGGLEEALARDGARVRVNCGGRLTVDTFALVAGLAVAGQGIALLPPDVAAPHAAAGTLRPVLAGWAPARLPVFVVMASRLLPARLRRFVDHLAERFPADGGAGEARAGEGGAGEAGMGEAGMGEGARRPSPIQVSLVEPRRGGWRDRPAAALAR